MTLRSAPVGLTLLLLQGCYAWTPPRPVLVAETLEDDRGSLDAPTVHPYPDGTVELTIEGDRGIVRLRDRDDLHLEHGARLRLDGAGERWTLVDGALELPASDVEGVLERRFSEERTAVQATVWSLLGTVMAGATLVLGYLGVYLAACTFGSCSSG